MATPRPRPTAWRSWRSSTPAGSGPATGWRSSPWPRGSRSGSSCSPSTKGWRPAMGTVIEAVGVAAGRRRRSSARRLADTAAARALAGAALEAADVDLLLNAGLYHDRILGEPALAALIQEDIGANPEDPHAGGHGTFSFDVANGSCGMLTALRVADGFLRAGSARHALGVASDADPGHRLAPGFPFAPAGAALACGWRPGDEGLIGFRFSAGEPGAGLWSSVGNRS